MPPAAPGCPLLTSWLADLPTSGLAGWPGSGSPAENLGRNANLESSFAHFEFRAPPGSFIVIGRGLKMIWLVAYQQ